MTSAKLRTVPGSQSRKGDSKCLVDGHSFANWINVFVKFEILHHFITRFAMIEFGLSTHASGYSACMPAAQCIDRDHRRTYLHVSLFSFGLK
jgi:hypothetical protein